MKGLLHLSQLVLHFSFCLSLPPPSKDPFVVYPISSQRPPIARVGQPFSWSFLNGTFSTSSGTAGISYTVTNLPPWATFTADDNTIHGTPDASHLGTTNVEITAYDAKKSGSVSETLRMLVSSDPAPTVHLPLETQLRNGAVLGSAKYNNVTKGISVPPNWSWSIGLLPDTFTTPGGSEVYYTAYQSGKSSLPSWIKFNTETATFDGVSPNEQQEIAIVVYGSDHFGYGDVQQNFLLTITQHVLDLTQPIPAINATVGSIINYTIPLAGFTIDGSPRNSSSAIKPKVDLSATPYLTYSESDFTISGTLPASVPSFTNVSIPISFSADQCYNNISTQIVLRVVPGLFVDSVLPPLYLYKNEKFNVDLKQYTSNLNATYSLGSVHPSKAQEWLHFSEHPLALTGKAPFDSNLGGSDLYVELGATGLDGVKSTARLPIFLREHMTKSSQHSLSEASKMAVVIFLSSLVGLILLITMMRCCRTHCSADGHHDHLEEDVVYTGHYVYPREKYEQPKPTPSLNKDTPLSDGEILINSHTPKLEHDTASGGPMMAVTQTELVLSRSFHSKTPSFFKRLKSFIVFKRGCRKKSPVLPTHRSLQGLGVVAPQHCVVNVTTGADGAITARGDVDEEYESEISISVIGGPGINRVPSSEEQSLSWTTTSSSSLFYSDDQEEASTSSSSTDRGNKSSHSIPRRRRDFMARNSSNVRSTSPPSPGVDIGTIRMVSNPATLSSLSSLCSTSAEGERHPFSESIGAIKTASYRKIDGTTPYRQGTGVSDGDSAYSLRAQLIPLKKQQKITFEEPSHLESSGEDEILHGNTEEDESEAQVTVEVSQRAWQASSAPSRSRKAPQLYKTLESKSGTPTTSPIFFSPPRENNGAALPINLASVAEALPMHDKPPTTPFQLGCHSNYQFEKTGDPGETSENLQRLYLPEKDGISNQKSAISIGVGEPFHMAPPVRSHQSNASISSSTSQESSRLKSPKAASLAMMSYHAARYRALTDYPEDPKRDRKQLPEWLHFDSGECEIWGIPRKADVGSLRLQIIERKSRNGGRQDWSVGSPAMNRPDETEEVVCRLTLEVVDRNSLRGVGHGDVTVVTF